MKGNTKGPVVVTDPLFCDKRPTFIFRRRTPNLTTKSDVLHVTPLHQRDLLDFTPTWLALPASIRDSQQRNAALALGCKICQLIHQAFLFSAS
jgi:hypothetical protein